MQRAAHRDYWIRSRTSSKERRFGLQRSELENAAVVAKSGILEGHPGPPPAISVSRNNVRVGYEPCRKRANRCDLLHPHLTEVHRRVTGLPALQEPLDRRVNGDRVELVTVKRTMPANRGVLRRHVLE